jgi:predicted acylesterase/phospholipase RssA
MSRTGSSATSTHAAALVSRRRPRHGRRRPRRPPGPVPEPVATSSGGLRTLEVMELSLEAVRTAVLRHTLASYPPDVLITVPRSACRTLDFHKAEEMIGLGRLLAAEALDGDGGQSSSCALGGRP